MEINGSTSTLDTLDMLDLSSSNTPEEVAIRKLLERTERRRQLRQEVIDVDKEVANSICECFTVAKLSQATIAKISQLSRQRVHEILSSKGFV